MVPLGSRAPVFALPDTDGGIVSVDDFQGAPALLVMFICNHCPYVQHLRQALADFGRQYIPRGLAILAINSNDPVQFPADSPAAMRLEKQAAGYPFPYLFDESQDVARAFAAACTPDFFLYDAQRRLAYRGQFDDSRPSNGIPVTGSDLRAATDAVLLGRAPSREQNPSIGCNIKWRA
jgi:peroxiredoxin